MLFTQIKVSITGHNKKPLRDAVAAVLITHGFRRVRVVEFFSDNEKSPEQAIAVLNAIYEQEVKYTGARLVTVVIRSSLINIEIKRDKNRSI